MPKVVDHEARRWEICAAAAQLIARGGLELATIREIAAASGYSKGVVEHYFNGKGELIGGALDWANRRYQQRVDRVTQGLAGIDALGQRVLVILPLNKGIRDEWKVRLVFWSMAAIDEDLRRRQAVRVDRAITHFEDHIEQAIEAGDISQAADAGALARRLLNVTTGISVAALHNRRLYTRRFLKAEAAGVIEQIVASGGRAATGRLQ